MSYKEQFLLDTQQLHTMMGQQSAWAFQPKGDTLIERAYAGWMHATVSLLTRAEYTELETLITATSAEFALRSAKSSALGLAPGERNLDRACEGQWADMPANDRAFNLGYVDALNGVDDPPPGFRTPYREGQEAYFDSLG